MHAHAQALYVVKCSYMHYAYIYETRRSRLYTQSPINPKVLAEKVGLFSRGYGTSLMSGLLLLVCRLRYKMGYCLSLALTGEHDITAGASIT